MNCHYDPGLGYRVTRDEDRCPERHCLNCGITHVTERVCASCVNTTRGELNHVVWLTLRTVTERNHHADATIPGGDATVLVGPYSLGAADQRSRHTGPDRLGYPAEYGYATDESLNLPGDPTPPLLVLATWEDDWRATFGHPAAGRATVAHAATYLLRHLHHAAQHHDAWDEFACEIRQLRGRLEDAVRDGHRDEPGVTCKRCGTTLIRVTDPRRSIHYCHGHGPHKVCPWPRRGCCDRGGLRDEWACPDCRVTLDREDYHEHVAATYRANAPALTAADIHAEYGVPRGSVRGWASAGKVRRRGKDLHGLQLYDVEDVCRHAGIDLDAGQTRADRVS